MANNDLQLKILKIVGRGVALAHHDGKTFLVAGALPDETVMAQPTRARAGVVEAATVQVLANPHPARVMDPCPHAPECGGCDWPHVHPELGAPLKAAVSAEAARSHADLAARLGAAPVQKSPLAYRLRARLHWDPAAATLGFYQRRSHQVISIPSCRILSPRLLEALPILHEALRHSCTRAADVEWLEDLGGTTAVAALRAAHDSKVRPGPAQVPSESALAPVVDGFHLLTASGSVHEVWGETTVRMDLPIPLVVPIGAFFQGNRHLAPWLFGRLAELSGDEPWPAWDLHAGVGFLAAAALTASERPLTAVEPFRPAARAAAVNLPGAQVAKGRTAESFLSCSGRLPHTALALTDPPRAGMSAELRRRIAGWHPRRLLMMACDPATWARDAASFQDRGYHLRHLELVDLFPSTHHVEVLAVLESE